MTILSIDKHNTTVPLYKQVVASIEHAIITGDLRPGDKLPPHRDLADLLEVNVSTITRGYKEAERKGLVSGTVGRGTYISSDASTNNQMVSFEPQAPGMLELGLANPLDHLDPDLNHGLQKLCRRKDLSSLMHYSTPGGLPEQRQIGARWASRYGLTVTANEIVVCSGAQHAIACVLSSLFRPGDCIATDGLTYPGIKTIATMFGVRLVPIKTDLSGMCVDSLDTVCRRQNIKGIYLIPGVQNPTTVTLPESRRKAISKVIKKHDLVLIEDDAYELTRPGIISPVSNFCKNNSIYIAGVSKAFAAGLRVAFMVVPKKLRKTLFEAVMNTVWMTPSLNVELINMWINDGVVDKVIKEKKIEAKKRNVLAGDILHNYTFQSLPTGFFIWLELPKPWTGNDFEKSMRKLGVHLFGAEKFTVGEFAPPAGARISLTGTKTQNELKVGLQLVKGVLDGGCPPPFLRKQQEGGERKRGKVNMV